MVNTFHTKGVHWTSDIAAVSVAVAEIYETKPVQRKGHSRPGKSFSTCTRQACTCSYADRGSVSRDRPGKPSIRIHLSPQLQLGIPQVLLQFTVAWEV